MTYRINVEVAEDIFHRNAVISELAIRARTAPTSWHQHLAEASLTLTSPDRMRIIKIDSSKVYTLDVRQTDGTYKSSRFTCTSVDEAWSMASQIVKSYKPKTSIH